MTESRENTAEILDSGWLGCTQQELERRRELFMQTAAELLAAQRQREREAVSGGEQRG